MFVLCMSSVCHASMSIAVFVNHYNSVYKYCIKMMISVLLEKI